jgi:histidine ammonia-lyase
VINTGPYEVHLGATLSPSDVEAVARGTAIVVVDESTVERVNASRAIVDKAAVGQEAVYGITTGFGILANTPVPPERRRELQRALIRSHAAGMGAPIERDVVRAMMLLRAHTLARGLSGVRVEVLERIASLLNADVVPVVPEFGSLGCSGDLAPLSHVAMVLIGEGVATTSDGALLQGSAALERAGIDALVPVEKEGLALINGTDGMQAMLALAIVDLRTLLTVADIAAAMTCEASMGTDRTFAADLIALRPHAGQKTSAANLVAMLAKSPIMASHRENDDRVQDPYAIRCSPQVHGAARDTFDFLHRVAEIERGSVVDNPVVLPDGRVESNGNFHGAPLGYAADFMKIALADLASISERRIDRLLDPKRSDGLPAFLAPDAGVNSGLMIGHYTAAALVHECRRLAMPSSIDSIPTSGMQEDHVSMGWSACRALLRSIENVRRVLAVELLTASRALALRAPLLPAPGTGAVTQVVIYAGGKPTADEFLSPQLEAVDALIRSGAVVAAAQQAVGSLR